MSRTLYWRTDDGLKLDTEAFLPGLERASGVEAVVTGKPAAAFFATALDAIGADASATVMVGDDIEVDVLAAQDHGITGVLVRTGKYRPETLRSAPAVPDQVIDSVADLPGLLGGPAFPLTRENAHADTAGSSAEAIWSAGCDGRLCWSAGRGGKLCSCKSWAWMRAEPAGWQLPWMRGDQPPHGWPLTWRRS